jgi:hypothetical protein
VVPHPLYAHYAALAIRPGGISALTDQQLAAGVMWVPGSISFTIAALICFYRWLEPEGGPLRLAGLGSGGAPPRPPMPEPGGASPLVPGLEPDAGVARVPALPT